MPPASICPKSPIIKTSQAVMVDLKGRQAAAGDLPAQVIVRPAEAADPAAADPVGAEGAAGLQQEEPG